jgi:uncharacterized protein (TIGR02118 family)
VIDLSDREQSKMAQLVVMYKTPKDTAAFDKYYSDRHIPIAKKIPGLRQYEISQGPVATPAGPSGYHLVALLEFDDLAAIQAAFGSAEGQAAVADVQNFATGGADIVMFDTRPA